MPLASPPSPNRMLPPNSFKNSVVMVVTTGHWLSQEIAASFASYGAAVVIAGKDSKHCEAAAAELAAANTEAFAIGFDPADPDSVADCFETLEQRLGGVGVLINPFSEGSEVPAEQMSPARWREVTDTLLDGSLFCAQELARRRIDDDAGAAIVNFATPFSVTGGAGLTPWETAKAGLSHLTKSLAVEWAPYNIRVNAVAPGQLEARGSRSNAQIAATLSAGRCCQAADVCACVLYACTPFAAYLTGHTFDIDGASWQRQGRLPPKFESIRSRYERTIPPPE